MRRTSWKIVTMAAVALSIMAAPAIASASPDAPAKVSDARPAAGQWKYYQPNSSVKSGSFTVTQQGKEVKNVSFTIANSASGCTPGKITIEGSFKITKGGPDSGDTWHVGGNPNINDYITVKFHQGTTTSTAGFDIGFMGPKIATANFGTAGCEVSWNLHK